MFLMKFIEDTILNQIHLKCSYNLLQLCHFYYKLVKNKECHCLKICVDKVHITFKLFDKVFHGT